MTIACVVPTIRPEQYERFVEAWRHQFDYYGVKLLTVFDGDTPVLEDGRTAVDVLGPEANLIYHRSDVCRNLGIAAAALMPDVEYILTLDDDCYPYNDTIGQHLDALQGRAPISWLSSSPVAYTRGFPYQVRDEAPIMVSHGIWHGNTDWDAKTQLANGNARLDQFYQGPIPRGVLFPFCGMNVMVRRAVLPWFYFAPMGPRASLDGQVWDRFGDIWLGICLKREMDAKNWAMVSGYAAVLHTRASDVGVNLRKEATGLEWNELFWQQEPEHPYFYQYRRARDRWSRWMAAYV